MIDHASEFSEFEPVLCYTTWWDCPRQGVSVVESVPHYFLSEFSEELDDFPNEFLLWPVDTAIVEQELTLWATWVKFREAFDAGLRPLDPTHDVAWVRATDAIRTWRHRPAAGSLRAIPRWRLAKDRSFRNGAPQHLVRWTVLDSANDSHDGQR